MPKACASFNDAGAEEILCFHKLGTNGKEKA